MFVKNEYGEYEADINGVKIICKNESDEANEIALEISSIYESRLSMIAQFLFDEGISDFFGKLTAKELIDSLGSPAIDISRETVTYLEHTLDDEHIIEFEYSGLLEKFLYLNIDG